MRVTSTYWVRGGGDIGLLCGGSVGVRRRLVSPHLHPAAQPANSGQGVRAHSRPRVPPLPCQTQHSSSQVPPHSPRDPDPAAHQVLGPGIPRAPPPHACTVSLQPPSHCPPGGPLAQVKQGPGAHTGTQALRVPRRGASPSGRRGPGSWIGQEESGPGSWPRGGGAERRQRREGLPRGRGAVQTPRRPALPVPRTLTQEDPGDNQITLEEITQMVSGPHPHPGRSTSHYPVGGGPLQSTRASCPFRNSPGLFPTKGS